MQRYIAIRLVSAITTLLGVVTLVFIVMRLVPGSIVDQILANGDSSEEVQRSLRAYFGLDRPIHIQYLQYPGSLLTGDLGVSWRARVPTLVTRRLAEEIALLDCLSTGRIISVFAPALSREHNA